MFYNVNIRNRQKLKITRARLEGFPTVPENCVEQIGSREPDNIVNYNGAIRFFVVSGDHLSGGIKNEKDKGSQRYSERQDHN